MTATVSKTKQKGKQPIYTVKEKGRTVATYEDNGKLGRGSARDLAQSDARKRNGGRSL